MRRSVLLRATEVFRIDNQSRAACSRADVERLQATHELGEAVSCGGRMLAGFVVARSAAPSPTDSVISRLGVAWR
jgi:hypothetical protein